MTKNVELRELENTLEYDKWYSHHWRTWNRDLIAKALAQARAEGREETLEERKTDFANIVSMLEHQKECKTGIYSEQFMLGFSNAILCLKTNILDVEHRKDRLKSGDKEKK